MWRSMLIDFFSLLLPNNKIPTSWNRWLIRCYKLNWDWSATFSHNFRRLCDVNKSLVKATLTGRELGVEMRWKILKLIHLAMDVFFRRGEKIFKSDYDWFFLLSEEAWMQQKIDLFYAIFKFLWRSLRFDLHKNFFLPIFAQVSRIPATFKNKSRSL